MRSLFQRVARHCRRNLQVRPPPRHHRAVAAAERPARRRGRLRWRGRRRAGGRAGEQPRSRPRARVLGHSPAALQRSRRAARKSCPACTRAAGRPQAYGTLGIANCPSERRGGRPGVGIPGVAGHTCGRARNSGIPSRRRRMSLSSPAGLDEANTSAGRGFWCAREFEAC